jgi:peptide/nickel transport system substrate-binding protein
MNGTLRRTAFKLFTAALASLMLTVGGLSLAQGGGVLQIGVNGDIDNFDPAFNQLIQYSATIGGTVFNALVSLGEDMEIVPGLAESWEQVDDTTWVFNLRQGVTFHNGDAFSVADVLHTFDRTLEQGLIFANKLAPIAESEAVDDHTLKLTLEFPVATLLDDLTLVAITPQGVSDEDLKQNPVGTGPFRFVSWTPNETITLERNPDYWEAGKPALDGITLRVLGDAATRIANLLSGEVDALYDVPVADAQAVAGDPNVVFQQPSASGSLFLIELGIGNNEALQDERVRRALAHALDKETIQQVAYFGQGEIICSPLPAFSWAYEAQDCPAFDLEQASALLEEAGQSDLELGIEVISGVKVMEDIATIWQASLAEIGVTLNVNSTAVSIWLDRYIGKTYDMTTNWFNLSADPNSMFDVIYKPLLDNVYDNEAMRAKILEAASLSDQAARTEIYQELQRETVETIAPLIVVQSQPLLALTSSSVDGWKMNGKNLLLLNDVTVE